MVVFFSMLRKDDELKVVFDWKDFFLNDKMSAVSVRIRNVLNVQYNKAGLFIFAG